VSAWLLTLLSASIGGLVSLLRFWLTLRLLWRVYERAGRRTCSTRLAPCTSATGSRSHGPAPRSVALLRVG
jgi:hypothetical protein